MTQQWTPEDSDMADRRIAHEAKTRELQTELVRKYVHKCLEEAGYRVEPFGNSGVYGVSALMDEHVRVTVNIYTTP